MLIDLPPSWQAVLAEALAQPWFARLAAFIDDERARHTVYPPEEDVFNALKLTPYTAVRVVVLGQDPYHDDGQAHGLAFSVRPGVPAPPSLRNIFRELQADVGCPPPQHGDLTPWARQGVLLLNTVLTVRAHQPHSHKGHGWEQFTDAVIASLNARVEPVIFVLWGGHAQRKLPLIDTQRHVVLRSAHPSPLAARNGFFGSRPFSRINATLTAWGQPPIDWCLPAAADTHPRQIGQRSGTMQAHTHDDAHASA
ncbi:uracil-DNA glycosylase [Kallotenue papyrolyticum]|uniref:uracil-DNA glycosylase n=1 Tax=Kallotenue papyrolyticum TaxID=1325125 RepID=UPI0004927FBB|nr:uracil-DNA glycosylase [Kallotenue papyrolyticum]